MIIKYDNIEVKRRKLLKEGKIEIGENGCYVIKGKNGCGKTLWLRRLHLKLGHESVYVAQNNDVHIHSESVIYNISLSRNDSDNEIICKELKEIGLDFLLDLKINKMSGGEKRLVSLLRGIYAGKEIIMLDEPLNDLDYIYANKIIELVKKMKKKRLFIIITHDDRFDKIVDGYINFEDGNIVVDAFSIISQSNKHKKEELKKIDFPKKKNIGNYVSLLLLLCMSIIYFSFFKITLNMDNDTEKLVLGSNQVNIYVPASSIGADMGIYGAFPLYILQEVMSSDGKEVQKVVSDVELIYSRENRTKLTDLYKNNSITMYPLEYYDYDNRQYFNSIQMYLEKKNCDGNNDAVKTMPTFLNWTNDKGNKTVDFKEEDFNKIVSELNSKKNYEIVFMTVILEKNMGLEEFLELKEVKELAEKKDVYIQTNETMDIYANVIKTIEQSEFIKKTLIFTVLIGSMDIGVYLLLLRRKRKQYILWANMGVEKGLVQKKVNISIFNFIMLVVWAVINIVISIFLSNKYKINNIVMLYFPCICMVLIFMMVVIIKGRLLSKEIDRAYKWNKR